LARLEPNITAKKGVDGADFGVHLGEAKEPVAFDGDFAISIPPQQLVHQIRYGYAPIA
jgi:hypothetical protein